MKIFIIWSAQDGILHGARETEEEAHELAREIREVGLYSASVEAIELNLESEIVSCTCRNRCHECRRCPECGKRRG